MKPTKFGKVIRENRHQNSGNRVMLVNLPISNPLAGSPADASVEHVGLGYIGAYLKSKGLNNVKLLDAYSRKLSKEQIIAEIKRFNPDFLCLSSTYLSWDLTVRILTRIKRENAEIITILGGPHVSFEPILSRALREYKCIDFIVRGEGEISTYKIIEQTIQGSCSQIPGVSHRESNGEIIIAEDFAEIADDLDFLPFPLRDTPPLQGKSLRITTSRGCYSKRGGCTFCSTPTLYPKGWRGRSAKNVVDELEFLNHQGFNSFICAEADFFGFSHEGFQRAAEIVEEMLRRRLKISLRIFAGINQINQAERYGLWEKLKSVGLERVYPGIESTCPDTLRLFGKSSELYKIYKAINILKRRQIALQIGFIMFHPWSTFKSIYENCRFLKYIDQAHLWNNFSNPLLLLPGTRLLEKAKSDNLLIKDLNEVGLGEEFVYNYRFLDLRIGRVSQICSILLNNPLISEMDRNLITTGIITSNSSMDIVPSEIAELKQVYETIKENLSYLNLNTFYRVIELCKAKYQDNAVESVLENHLNEVKKITPKLKAALKRASINVY